MPHASFGVTDPVFSRSDVARILNVTPLTIANREKTKRYPEPHRDLNNYRIYTLQDVLNLQILTFFHVDPRPILSMLYDRGIQSPKEASKLIDQAMSTKRGRI